MKKASGGLMAICIIAILFGLLGFLSVAVEGAGPMIGEAIKKSVRPANRRNGPMEQRQEQLEQDIKVVTDKWVPVTYSLMAVHVVVAFCLIFGGVQAMRLQPNGRQLLAVAFLLAIVFSIVKLIPTVSIQLATIDITERFLAEALKGAPGSPPPPPGVQRMMGASMKFGMFLGFAITGVWLLIKLGFYGFGTMYLRRPQTVAQFEPSAELDWSDDEPADSDQAE